MTKVYLISALGADSRLFKNIKLPSGFEKVLVNWHVPDSGDTISTYAQNIVNQYHITDKSIVVGVSLGGVITTEIAKKVQLRKAILVSSIRTDGEASMYFKIFRSIPVYKAIPGKLMTLTGELIKPMFGSMSADDLLLFKSMLRDSSPLFMKWAMKAILNWRNETVPPNLYHIIGDKDRVFPYKTIQNPTAVIKGGTHIMVFDKADEINKILADILAG